MKVVPIQVTLLDHMGTDLSVVNAARVSFEKESAWEGYSEDRNDKLVFMRKLSDADAKLISYLAKRDHWSPFAHTSVQFRIKAPIFVARQLVKHQVGGVWNEESRRYIDSEPEFYFPEVWHGRPVNAKQGAGVPMVNTSCAGENDVAVDVHELTKLALQLYLAQIQDGIAPEEARMCLPLNTMTEWIWTGSAMFWARVCKQRLDSHAQGATSSVARQINTLIEPLFPISWKALLSK
jgi:thymidylate synthase (FAD)